MVLSQTLRAKMYAQHSPGMLLLGSARFNANPAGGTGDALHTQVVSNIRASTTVSVLDCFTGGINGGGEAVAHRTPGSPTRLVPTVTGLVGFGTGKATDSMNGVQSDAAPPWRVTVKQ